KAACPQQRADLQSAEETRPVAFLQAPESRKVEMVVMIVRQQNEINLGEVLEAHSRRPVPARARPRDGTDALRPDRVGQGGDVACLNEKRCMVDESHPQVGDAARGRRTDRAIEVAPLSAAACPHPFEKVAKSSRLEPGVVETLAVEVLRLRS